MHYLRRSVFAILLGALSAVIYAASATVVETATSINLQNDHLEIAFQKPHFVLSRIASGTTAANFVVQPQTPVFRISFWNRETPSEEILEHPIFRTSANDAGAVNGLTAADTSWETKRFANGVELLLHYLGIPVPDGNGATVDVTISIRLEDDANLTDWCLSIENRSNRQLYDVEFPILKGLGSTKPNSAQTDYVIQPVGSGDILRHPRSNQGGIGFYPNCMCMQVVGYCDGQGETLYYGCHDKSFYRKEFRGSHDGHSFGLWVSAAPDQSGMGHWELPYATSIGVISGDWYDVAKTYRANFIAPTFPTLAERVTAEWFLRNNVWVQGGAVHYTNRIITREGDMPQLAADLLRFRNQLGEDFAFHWYVWHKHVTFDQFYPDYLPAQPEFHDTDAQIEAAGVHTMPYINSHFFDTLLPEWNTGDIAKNQVLDIKPGRIDHKLYTMRTMCMGQTAWQDRIVEIERGILHEYPVTALYLDEMGSLPELCYDRTHEHPAHGGSYYAAGQNAILRRIREAPEWGTRKPVIVGKCMHDAHLGLLDGLLNGHMDLDFQRPPFFQAACSGYAQEIGIYLYPEELNRDTFMAKLGFTLVRGRQLGWFNTLYQEGKLDLTKPEHATLMDDLRRMCAVRTAALPFVTSGELLRPPQFDALPKVQVDWRGWIGPGKSKPNMREVPAVFGQTWKTLDNFTPAIGFFFVNHTAQPRQVVFPWDERNWGLKIGTPVTQRTFVDGEWHPAKPFPLPRQIVMEIPPYTPMLVVFQ